MSVLKIVKANQADFGPIYQGLKNKLSLEGVLLDDKSRLAKVRQIVEKVRQGGDTAVAELTAAYDGVALSPEEFRIPPEALKAAHRGLEKDLLRAVREAVVNIVHYQRKILNLTPEDWDYEGVRLGLRYRPLQRVGVCVPGASAPLVSTVLMTVLPAKVAGVKEVAVISAPSHHGTINPDILGVCYELGVSEVYRVSGAQAVAALAFGTDHIPKVDKIVGPSNWWGQLAKKEVYGLVDIDSFAGPSEVLIIADETANPAWVAADMLSQAEHAPGSAVLVSDSESFVENVARQLEIQLKQLGRADATRECIKDFSLAIITADIAEAIELANDFAVEHLQVQCKDSDKVAEQVVNAGAIFIGHHTPVATGDYFAGPSHTLPTGGSAKFFSALNSNDFLKQSSIIHYNEQALKDAAGSIMTIASAEGLGAHGRSVSIRTE
ncbi:MAG: histidinol dehydrogenase [Phycisphaerae bacterium]|nr:histidinol dehydrogenase [Phycisphaerae bacterium]